MSQFASDPIAFSEALQAAGMPKAQADVIAKYQQASLDRMVEARDLATKKDLMELELRLTTKIDQSRYDALKWTFAMLVAFAAAIVGLLK